ncbi:MAG: hypothetical protein NTV97_21480 [Alphaproteobacteria bacterium]|nr:hypothetical protein [Alphaproteobacteria bacterium]
MSLADLDDPVRPGDSTTLVCTVTNTGAQPTGRLDLIVILPDQARLDSDRSASRVRIDDSRVAFDPIQPIAPGSQRSFVVLVALPSVHGSGESRHQVGRLHAARSLQAVDGRSKWPKKPQESTFFAL